MASNNSGEFDPERVAEIQRFMQNPFGVGRSPSYVGNPTTFDTGVINEDIDVTGGVDTHTIDLGAKYQRLMAVWVSLSRNEAGGVPFGSIVGGKCDIELDGKTIASFSLPSSNEWGFQINEIIPLNVEVLNSKLELKIGAASGGSYNVFLRMKAFTIPV